MLLKLWPCRVIWFLFEGFKTIILCSIVCRLMFHSLYDSWNIWILLKYSSWKLQLESWNTNHEFAKSNLVRKGALGTNGLIYINLKLLYKESHHLNPKKQSKNRRKWNCWTITIIKTNCNRNNTLTISVTATIKQKYFGQRNLEPFSFIQLFSLEIGSLVMKFELLLKFLDFFKITSGRKIY